MQPVDVGEIATFVRVVRHGSLAGAAKELSVPKSTVSRRIARLEERLDIELFHRSPRSLRITQDGKRIYDSVSGAVDTIELAMGGAHADAALPRGNIRLTAPADYGRLVLIDELVAFAEAFPEITVELLLTDDIVDLVADGFDLAVRAGRMRDTSASKNLIARRLTETSLQLAASPELAHRITSPGDLEREPFVHFRTARAHQTLHHTAGRSIDVMVQGRFVVHDYAAMAELVARGVGVGLMPSMHIERAVVPGRLVRVLPELSARAGKIFLVYPTRRLPERVRVLIDYLTRGVAAAEAESQG